MKLVRWDDNTVPEIYAINESGVYFYDTRLEWNIQEGDLIHYLSEEGTTCYDVVCVEPASQDFDGLEDDINRVVLQLSSAL